MNERRLRDALHASPADPEARRRAWEVVAAAYADHRPRARSGGGRRGLAAAAAVLVVGAGLTVAPSAPGEAVARWMGDVLGLDDGEPRESLVRVPGGGRLLVEAASGTWVVAADGARRRVGAYDGASWSPQGRFAIAWRDGQLTAIEPDGRPRWSLTRPEPITSARWGPVDGFRIAYLAGGSLHVVNGDGTGDRRLAGADRAVPPAWRPDDDHVLAYAGRDARIRVVAADTGEQLWRTRPVEDPVGLGWSGDGRRLAVAGRGRLLVFDRAGRPRTMREAPGRVITGMAWRPGARELAVVREVAGGRRGEVLVGGRIVFSGPGRLGAPTWSPGGDRLLVPWRDADQWLFLRPGARRADGVAGIARQFDPGGAAPRFPARVEWCCASAAP